MTGMKAYAVEKITEQELRDIQNDFDPIEAPPGPYKVQPENQGTYSYNPLKIFVILFQMSVKVYSFKWILDIFKLN